jgi:hypothetical protein
VQDKGSREPSGNSRASKELKSQEEQDPASRRIGNSGYKKNISQESDHE